MLEVRKGARGNGLNTSSKPTLPPGSPAQSSAASRGKQYKWPLVDARSPFGPFGSSARCERRSQTRRNGSRYANLRQRWSPLDFGLQQRYHHHLELPQRQPGNVDQRTSPAGTPNDSKVANLAYTWDANKNKLSEVHSGINATVNGFGFNAADTTYDFEDRLTQWKRANGTENQSWNLTAVGDWQSFTRNGTSTARTHGPTHELLAIGSSSLSYDAKGNLTQDTSRSPTQNYIWDFDNKMKSADIDGNGSPDVTFEFDALGRRVARTQGSDAVIYYQVDQQTIADYPRCGAAASPTYRYFWASYIDELIARKATGSAESSYLRIATNSIPSSPSATPPRPVVERISYTAYGQPTFTNATGTTLSSSAKATRYSYTVREWDPSLQLHHFRARWMSGVSGRFIGRDPIGYLGSTWNIYGYLSSRAIIEVDPMGLHNFPLDRTGPSCRQSSSSVTELVCKYDFIGYFGGRYTKKSSIPIVQV